MEAYAAVIYADDADTFDNIDNNPQNLRNFLLLFIDGWTGNKKSTMSYNVWISTST